MRRRLGLSKPGGQTIAEAERRYGPRPAAPYSAP